MGPPSNESPALNKSDSIQQKYLQPTLMPSGDNVKEDLQKVEEDKSLNQSVSHQEWAFSEKDHNLQPSPTEAEKNPFFAWQESVAGWKPVQQLKSPK